MRGLTDRVFNSLFPTYVTCVVCHSDSPLDERGRCKCCSEALALLTGRVCSVCGLSIDTERVAPLCRHCLKATYHFDQVKSCYVYSERIKQAVHRMKYNDQTYYGRYFAPDLATLYTLMIDPVDMVFSVPTSKDKLNRMGYHGAELLTAFFCELTGLNNGSDLLVKVRSTPTQSSLTGVERRLNLRGAFLCKEPLRHIKRALVIDDVFTTGSTISEAARALKSAGVTTVIGLTLATANRE